MSAQTSDDVNKYTLPSVSALQHATRKAIVEDNRRLNRILVEELTKQNIKLPEGE